MSRSAVMSGRVSAPVRCRIHIITPAARGSRLGNRVTAERWARMLRTFGHQVSLSVGFDDQRCDVLVALHAKRSAEHVERFRQLRPDGALVVALTGTDVYRDLPNSRAAQQSLEHADAIIALQSHAKQTLRRKRWRDKTHVVLQSVSTPRAKKPAPRKRTFDVCVVAHMRTIKDPMRAAMAARGLPASSQIAVLQLGAALEPRFERLALAEMDTNPRYVWLGSRPRHEARRIIARSRLLVLSSIHEGAAHVLAEALVAATPVLSSTAGGLVAQLGDDYPGLFAPRDTIALRALMTRAEIDRGFYRALLRRCQKLAPRYRPAVEKKALQQAVMSTL